MHDVEEALVKSRDEQEVDVRAYDALAEEANNRAGPFLADNHASAVEDVLVEASFGPSEDSGMVDVERLGRWGRLDECYKNYDLIIDFCYLNP